MVEALGITIDRLPKRRPIKRESSTKEKIGCDYFPRGQSLPLYWV